MDVETAILHRRSIHKYLDIPVEMEKVGRMLEAALHAPSAGNVQPWRFILVTDEDVRKKIASSCLQQHWMSRAPVHIVVTVSKAKTARLYGAVGEQYVILDGAAAIQSMLLVATSQGLGSCWVGAFEDEMLHRLLEIPDSAKILAVLPVGYADEAPPMPLRLTVENVTWIGGWGSRMAHTGDYFGYTSHHVQNLIKKGKLVLKKVSDKLHDV